MRARSQTDNLSPHASHRARGRMLAQNCAPNQQEGMGKGDVRSLALPRRKASRRKGTGIAAQMKGVPHALWANCSRDRARLLAATSRSEVPSGGRSSGSELCPSLERGRPQFGRWRATPRHEPVRACPRDNYGRGLHHKGAIQGTTSEQIQAGNLPGGKPSNAIGTRSRHNDAEACRDDS